MKITIGCPRCKGAIRMKGEIIIRKPQDLKRTPQGHTRVTTTCPRCGWSGDQLLIVQCHHLATSQLRPPDPEKI